jgi:hypothetical protein
MQMTFLTVVATVHSEEGAANISQLVAILERSQPETIFLEIPLTAINDYSDGTRSNLESAAARQYRESHHVPLIPVDLPEPEDEFFRKSQYLFDRVEKTSPSYRRLLDWNKHQVAAYGFTYLNSERCNRLWRAVHEAVLDAIRRLRDPGLVEHYELWSDTHVLRDRTMVSTVNKYCAMNLFERGILLVGAAHVQSIIDISRGARGLGPSVVRWERLKVPDEVG